MTHQEIADFGRALGWTNLIALAEAVQEEAKAEIAKWIACHNGDDDEGERIDELKLRKRELERVAEEIGVILSDG